MIGIILAIYIANSTLNSLLFKKNKRSSLDTLLSIAFFGLAINSVAFGFSINFVTDIWAGLSLTIGAISLARGVLIVAGLFFVTKAFKLLPISIMSPLSMVIIVPLLLLSWWIFGDSVSTIVLILVCVMLAFCIGLVVIEGLKKKTTTNSKGGTLPPIAENPLRLQHTQNQHRRGRITMRPATENTELPTQLNQHPIDTKKQKLKGYWLGILFFIIAMTCFLATQIFTRVLADSGMQPFTITFLNSVVIFVTVLVAFAALRKNPVKILTQNARSPLQLAIAFTDSLWLFLYLPLVTAMNLGVLNATSRISTALVVLAGIFLFKERPKRISYILIAGIIIIGVVLAFLSS